MKKTLLLSLATLITVICFSQTQAEMNEQANKEYKKADEIMTAAYKLAMTNQDAAGKKLLLEAQRAWIKYKEAHCNSASSQHEGGSMYPLIYYSCLTQLTKERTAKLKVYVEEF